MSTETHAPQTADQALEALCQQARVLATKLPGALTRLTVMAGDNRVEVEWLAAGQATDGGVVLAVPAAAEPEAAAAAGTAVVAPLVGTYYGAPEPDAPPFVSEGDLVEAGQQVAIVEAMKIMNAVHAEHAGRVTSILAKDGDMVEFGQQLLIIEPADAES